MMYLDSSRATELLHRCPECFPPRDQRLVGVDRDYDSGYHSIIRFFGDESIEPARIEIRFSPGRYEIPDPLIREFAGRVADRLRTEGRLYDGPTVTGFRFLTLDTSLLALTVQETTYADFAGSLFALDLPDPVFEKWGGTLRDYYLAQYGHSPFVARPLANGLGVCGHLLLEEAGDRYLLRIRRAAKLATMAGTLGPSAAGSVDFQPDYRSIEDILQRQLGMEVKEELGLTSDEFTITPLAFALEIFRGDNPQLFGLITTALTRNEISSRLEALPPERKEFAEFSFLPLNQSGRLDVALREGLNFEATMSYFMLEEYLQDRDR